MSSARPAFLVRVGPCGRALLAIACCAVAAWGWGCASDPTEGYSFASSHDSSIRTVHVPMFSNPTFARGIEAELTDAIIKEIQRTTPWKVADGAVAETILSGSITSASMRNLTDNRVSGMAQELSYTLTVDFDWVEVRSGRTLVSRRSFSAADTFVPTPGVGERLDVAQHGAVSQLARDIVAELRSPW